ncbi:MAG: PEGA domain-containing protein [Myxococcales bacterium]
MRHPFLGLAWASLALPLAVFCGPARRTCAQELAALPAPPEPAYYVLTSAEPARREVLESAASAWLVAHGEHAEPLRPTALTQVPALTPRSELRVLEQVESLLREGRELSARFDERLALRRYAEAEQLLRSSLEIPQVHAWLAEVNLQLGLCAAQLGELGLAETALGRAASLDPQRTVQAAEAPPSLVHLAHAIEQRRARAPASQVLIETEPAGATLWLDGRRVGQAPHEMSLSSGMHVLRVAAPGRRTYAALLELGPGRRSPVRVELDEEPAEQARRELLAQLGRPSQVAVHAHALSALIERPLWIFEAGTGPLARGLVRRCDPECTLVATLGEGPALALTPVPSSAEELAWLSAEPRPSAHEAPANVERPWWKRWPAWTVGALVVVGAGVTAAVLAARDPKVVDERQLVLDPGSLPPP